MGCGTSLILEDEGDRRHHHQNVTVHRPPPPNAQYHKSYYNSAVLNGHQRGSQQHGPSAIAGAHYSKQNHQKWQPYHHQQLHQQLQPPLQQQQQQQAWYPNQPPGFTSYNHGVIVLGGPRRAGKRRGKSAPRGGGGRPVLPPPGAPLPPSGVPEAAQVWRSAELRPDDILEPVEERDGLHPDHKLILGVTENFAAFEAKFLRNTDGRLYEDPDFPADDSSLLLNKDKNKGIVWKRPVEICEQPLMFVDGTSREDVVQGTLADCWFLAACAGIAQHRDLIKQVIPAGQQRLFPPGYIGAVHFRFWRFGRWVDVVIDDRLPTRRNKVAFASSSSKNEFWPALLEKAYAKLNGTYQGLVGGVTTDAFVDLTGGVVENFKFSQAEVTPDFYSYLYKAMRTKGFLSCSKKNATFENVTANEYGIVPGHAYTITDAQIVKLRDTGKGKWKRQGQMEDKTVKLLRIRNPWANEKEWIGDWSDSSPMWQNLDPKDWQRLNPQNRDDGEFWMNFEDFCEMFNSVNACTLGPDFDGDGEADVNKSGGGYCVVNMRGRWVKNVSAGGCVSHDTFHTNPQFSFTLLKPDDGSFFDSPEKRGKCSIIIAVIQDYRRSKKNLGIKKHKIGFNVYQTDNPNARHVRKQLRNSLCAGKSGTFINFRQVYRRFLLDPGSYVIVPSTYESDIPGGFMVRVFTENRAICRALGP